MEARRSAARAAPKAFPIGAARVATGHMRAHLIGVAGAGMAPLAGLLREAGVDVRGSDVAFDPPMGPRLAAWGVETVAGTDPALLDGLDPARDVVVVGNVCRRDHPLAVAAEARGLRRVSMPTALSELVFTTTSGRRPVVAVAGTHGKTTTTGLLATILAGVGREPGFLIGGVPVAPIGGGVGEPKPFALGRSTRSLLQPTALAPFVIEGDEYDSAFFEKQPKVFGYRPTVLVLTSIEHDHVDIYPNESDYFAAFAGMLERLPDADEGGLLVANVADRGVARLLASAPTRARIVGYAASSADGRSWPATTDAASPPIWTAHEVGLGGNGDAVQPFDLFVGPTSAGRFGVGVFGVHNVSNALAAIAAAAEAFGVPARDAARALGGYTGIQRRQQRLVDGTKSDRGVTVYDDFAHHPTAIDATLRSIRARHRDARLWAAYEPRSATACRATHQAAYADAFDVADVIVLAPLGRTNLAPDERLDLEALATALRARGKEVICPESVAAVIATLAESTRAGDVIVAMSNGAFGGAPARLTALLGDAEPAKEPERT